MLAAQAWGEAAWVREAPSGAPARRAVDSAEAAAERATGSGTAPAVIVSQADGD